MNLMHRLIRLAIPTIVVFVLLTLSIFLGSPQISSRLIIPRVSETIKEDPVILSVVNQDGGMVCNTDKYLRLRVYLSGRIEGDTSDGKTCHRQRKTAIVDEIRLANLRRALEHRDLLTCKNEYPQFAIYTDTYTHSVMTFTIGEQEKSIKLTNPASDDPRNIANYPKQLLALLRVIDEITEHFDFR